MHKFIDQIKKHESDPYVVNNFLDQNEIELFQKLYAELPLEIDNKRQKIIKKKWSKNFYPDLQEKYNNKLKSIIGNFKMDNPKTRENLESLGLFQESYLPVNLHVDTGYDFEKIIYKQTLLPLSADGETIIFKNKFYGCPTTFSIDPNELNAKGFNKRSSEHLKIYGGKIFNKGLHKKYLVHENIDNLKGLEVNLVYKWKLGDLLIFDRTNLHCASSNIRIKKLGLTTLTKI
jgi:hypothetical protein|tara:strand:+ start:991 stop:1686 length:696 start_codon:yes stop_codon:yes gene_type:complete